MDRLSTIHSITKQEFLDLLNLLSTIAFGSEFEGEFFEDPIYKYRIALLIFAVSHGLRPSVGFETPLEYSCLDTPKCRNRLQRFFRDNNINLDITTDPFLLIYNIDIPLSWFEQNQDEDHVQWLGRLFGYWTPLSKDEYENIGEISSNNIKILIYYEGDWHLISGFESIDPFTIDMSQLIQIRKAFDVLEIPHGDIELHISISSSDEIKNVSIIVL